MSNQRELSELQKGIIAAVAGGFCTEENSEKVMDTVLVMAIADGVHDYLVRNGTKVIKLIAAEI